MKRRPLRLLTCASRLRDADRPAIAFDAKANLAVDYITPPNGERRGPDYTGAYNQSAEIEMGAGTEQTVKPHRHHGLKSRFRPPPLSPLLYHHPPPPQHHVSRCAHTQSHRQGQRSRR